MFNSIRSKFSIVVHAKINLTHQNQLVHIDLLQATHTYINLFRRIDQAIRLAGFQNVVCIISQSRFGYSCRWLALSASYYSPCFSL